MRRWLIVSAKPMLHRVYSYVESNSHKKITRFENVIFIEVKCGQGFFGKYSIVWKKLFQKISEVGISTLWVGSGSSA